MGETVTLYAKWGPFLISNKEEWDFFCSYANSSPKTNAKLMADITESVNTMLCLNRPFMGTFDGCGHTLTVGYKDITEDYAAPFRLTSGAEIKNLKVTGKISTSARFASGLIGNECDDVNKKTTTKITNCIIDVDILSSVEGDGMHGGFVGEADFPVEIKNSAFTGSIKSASATAKTKCCAGFVGSGSAEIENCLLAATFDLDETGCSTFARSVNSVTNCYYLNPLGKIEENAKPINAKNLVGRSPLNVRRRLGDDTRLRRNARAISGEQKGHSKLYL